MKAKCSDAIRSPKPMRTAVVIGAASTLLLPILAGCDQIAQKASEILSQKSPATATSEERESLGAPPPVENISTKERLEATELEEAKDPFEKERDIFNAEIRGLFEQGEFAKLEELSSGFILTNARFGDGESKLSWFYTALGERYENTESGVEEDLMLHRRWEQLYPESEARMIALSKLLWERAWRHRWAGYESGRVSRSEVSRSVKKFMGEQFDQSRALLETVKKKGVANPYWYVMAVRLGAEDGFMQSLELNALVTESLQKNPEFIHPALTRGSSLHPDRLGKEGEWENYAQEMSNMVPAGDELYAHLIINIHTNSRYNDVFKELGASWEKAKSGLKKLIKKHPDSLYYQNYAAYFGTIARDKDFAHESFEKIGNTYLLSVWESPERFAHFRTWARTGEW